MKALKYIISALAIGVGTSAASAQYYEIANQLPSLISPALSGSLRYKGFVDLSGTAGLGDNRANFAGISTTQGFQYADWFFMGAGLILSALDVPAIMNTASTSINAPTNTPRCRTILQRRSPFFISFSELSAIANHIFMITPTISLYYSIHHTFL